jgi:hypothetical protein
MDNNLLIGGSVIAALLFWWGTKGKQEENIAVVENACNAPAFASQCFTTPGVLVLNPKFSQLPPQDANFTTLNVKVESPQLNMLAQKYIPLFGFVGIAPATQAAQPAPIVISEPVYSAPEQIQPEQIKKEAYTRPLTPDEVYGRKSNVPVVKNRFLENNIHSWRSSLQHG